MTCDEEPVMRPVFKTSDRGVEPGSARADERDAWVASTHRYRDSRIQEAASRVRTLRARLLGTSGVRGRLQIVYGLLYSAPGVPVAIEAFESNTADPKTLGPRSPSSKPGSG